MLVPQYFWKCQQYLIGCLCRFWVSSQTPPSLRSLLWLMLGNHVTYCPTWGLLSAKGVLLITMLNNKHRPGLSQKSAVSPPLDRVGCFLPSFNSQSTFVCSPPMCLHVNSHFCLRIPQRRGPGLFYLYLQHLSSARHRDDTKCHQQRQMFV